ncbi:helix-turn-helix domain-containing protein [Sphingomonas sp. GV3]|uniref:helix-turn-helix domain-containing protein n=1 Tax=Sphingomonas sp. GV3 TaxID=3040671 RepID=UPI00280A5DE5|nr:helix-turn-helix domain-containing protein [Sphingomonas sp. GV3]
MTACTLSQASALALRDRARPVRGGLTAWRPARSGGLHRTGAPVRRDSIEAGTFEAQFFAVPAKGETDRLLNAARRALDIGRSLRREARAGTRLLDAAETAIAALTAGAVRVFEELLTLARLNKGQVFPSYDHLAAATGLGRATVARALRSLEAAGLLVTQRRFKRVPGEGAGPRYAQTSNVYRAMLPARLLALLPRRFRPAPLPEDQIQHDADRAEDQARMLEGLSCRDLASTTVGGALGAMLARLGAALDASQRESQDDPQPLPDSIRKDEWRWPSRPTRPA